MEDSATEKQPRLKTLRSNEKQGFTQDSKDSQTETQPRFKTTQHRKHHPANEEQGQQMKDRLEVARRRNIVLLSEDLEPAGRRSETHQQTDRLRSDIDMPASSIVLNLCIFIEDYKHCTYKQTCALCIFLYASLCFVHFEEQINFYFDRKQWK